MKACMLTAIAALSLLGAHPCFAQNTTEAPPARAPAAQQNAPAEKVAPPIHDGQLKSPDTKPETSGQAPAPGPRTDDLKDDKPNADPKAR